MICTELEDRLFDEDCRAALAGKGPVPADVAAHVALCAACSAALSEAVVEARRLSARLVVAPPTAVRRALYGALRSPSRARIPRIDPAFLSWTLAGGAFGASVAGNWLGSAAASQCAGFCLGLTCGVFLAAFQRTHDLWLGPLASLKSAASHCVYRLAQMV